MGIGWATNWLCKNCFSPYVYRDCNAIERMFCRLKDFSRIATRYDEERVAGVFSVDSIMTV